MTCYARPNYGWRALMAIAAVAVSLSACVTEERNISRESQVAVTPAPTRQCTVGELQMALAARERGYYYMLQCS
jgi:hypothetical protein